jgi:hypothetical protein
MLMTDDDNAQPGPKNLGILTTKSDPNSGTHLCNGKSILCKSIHMLSKSLHPLI